MCGCSAPIVSSKEVPAGSVAIPLNLITNDDFGSILVNAWCMNPAKVKIAFKPVVGEDISENSFDDLIKVHNTGADVKEYKSNFLYLVKSIIFTDAERNKPSCPFVYTI